MDSIQHDDQGDFQIYRYAIVGLEALSFVVMVLAMTYMRKTIIVFGLTEYDQMRNQLTSDFYTKVQNNTSED